MRLVLLFLANLLISAGWMYALQNTSISIPLLIELSTSIMGSGLDSIIALATSPYSIIFLILLPISFAIIARVIKESDSKKEAAQKSLFVLSPALLSLIALSSYEFSAAVVFIIIGTVFASFALAGSQVSAYSSGSQTSKYIVFITAAGIALFSYLSVSSNMPFYTNITISKITGMVSEIMPSISGGTELNASTTKELYLDSVTGIIGQVFSTMATDQFSGTIANASAERDILVTSLYLSGVKFNDSVSAIVDAITPTIRSRVKTNVQNYFKNTGNALTASLRSQASEQYDEMAGNSTGMVNQLFDSGPLADTLRRSLQPGIAFLLFSLVTLIGTLVLNPLTGVFSILLSKIIKPEA